MWRSRYSPHPRRPGPEQTGTGDSNGVRAIHARVQAKRVQREEFGQADQVGHIDIDRAQSAQLMSASQEALSELSGLQRWLATFARFNATPPCGNDDLGRCGRHNHVRACAQHEPSLWIAQASEIHDLGVAPARVQEVVEHSVRLDCILPCIDGPDVRQGPAARGFSFAAGLPSYQECIDGIRRNPALLKSFEGALRIFV